MAGATSEDFFAPPRLLAALTPAPITALTPDIPGAEAPMATPFDQTSLESLEIGATPVVRRFLERLQLAQLFLQYLSPNARRPEELPKPVTLCILVANL